MVDSTFARERMDRNDLPKTNLGKILRRELRDSMLKKAA
jgi:acyl-coenzyme A synthetase/AMP-(fatty) acid ligase